MALYKEWFQKAYDQNGSIVNKTWEVYLPLEQAIYENMLTTKETHIKGTLTELSKSYNMPIEFVCGFFDGIKDALCEELDVENFEVETEVDVTVDFKMLFKKMVEYKADHLYSLEQWSNVFSAEELKEMYTEQKKSGTIVREGAKIGRNDPCPCGSGRKYKMCCINKTNAEA